MIGKLYINDNNTIVPEDLLYGDFSAEDKYDKPEGFTREDFAITLYDDETHSDFDHDGGGKPLGQASMYALINEIIVSNAGYQSIVDAEDSIFNSKVHSIENLMNQRTKITKR